jgi:hypothetical protein
MSMWEGLKVGLVAKILIFEEKQTLKRKNPQERYIYNKRPLPGGSFARGIRW